MSGIGRYAATRAALAIPMVLVLVSLIFLVLRVIPGDPCLAMLGGLNVTPARMTECRHALGVDRPIASQYLRYLGSLLHGNFGTSTRTGLPILVELRLRFPATLELTGTGMAVAVLLGVGSGILAAARRGGPTEHILRVFNMASFSIPVFWIGLMFIMVFAVQLRWLPVGGRLDPLAQAFFRPITGFYVLDALLRGEWTICLDALRHLLLPAVTLGLVTSGLIGRMTRASMLAVLDREYITVARSKGLREWVVIFHHALRNALIPILTVVGLQVALLMAGAILTETVFSWPGIARYLLDSIEARDFPAIQGTVVFIAIFISAVNLIVDILYARLDPRVRYT
jgi:peptide/nickel transport system permease protein